MGIARQLLPSPGKPAHIILLPCSPCLLLTSLRLFSTSGGVPPPRPSEEPAPPHFMVEYLVTSCGLSRVEAVRTSRYYTHRKSPETEKPDAVLRLLRQEGLVAANIRRLILSHPRVLLADAKKTLEPKIRALRAAGFSEPELAELISTSPAALQLRNVLPRVEFWRDLLGSNRDVLKALGKAPYLLAYNPQKRVVPRFSLLHSLGIPKDTVRTLILKTPRLVFTDSDRIKGVIEQAKSLGASPHVRVFADVLYTLFYINRSILDAKSKLLRGFGWSQAELLSAFQRHPYTLRLSRENLRATMDFLLKEAGCEPSYVARHPVLLGFSIQKRLMPRHRVLQCLRREGLPGSLVDLCSAMKMPEEKFVKKFVVPNREKFGEILEPYYVATSKKISC